MAIRLKDLTDQPDLLTGGHRACAGCTAPSALRQMMLVAGKDTVVGCATGCMEVVTTIYPFTAWRVPFIHNAFENSAATISGAEAAYNALKRRGAIPADKKINFIAMGGDGGTYDIGFQALSGMAERKHKVLYLCYDNNAYMNTGIQRSGATPHYAWTTTTHAGEAKKGKEQMRKDLAMIAVAHEAPYVATAVVGPGTFWRDFMGKVQRALATDGPSVIVVLAPCWRGWRIEYSQTLEIGKLAAETGAWPLYEVIDGKWKWSYTPKVKRPIQDYLKPQGRFSHLFQPGNEALLTEVQAEVDRKWTQVDKFVKMSES
jgi:pyruvate ferredoxin oxidoreductase beta subunit